VVQIWPGLFVCKQVTVCPGHIWTTLYCLPEQRLFKCICSHGRSRWRHGALECAGIARQNVWPLLRQRLPPDIYWVKAKCTALERSKYVRVGVLTVCIERSVLWYSAAFFAIQLGGLNKTEVPAGYKFTFLLRLAR
jgi:hypothetical protein